MKASLAAQAPCGALGAPRKWSDSSWGLRQACVAASAKLGTWLAAYQQSTRRRWSSSGFICRRKICKPLRAKSPAANGRHVHIQCSANKIIIQRLDARHGGGGQDQSATAGGHREQCHLDGRSATKPRRATEIVSGELLAPAVFRRATATARLPRLRGAVMTVAKGQAASGAASAIRARPGKGSRLRARFEPRPGRRRRWWGRSRRAASAIGGSGGGSGGGGGPGGGGGVTWGTPARWRRRALRATRRPPPHLPRAVLPLLPQARPRPAGRRIR